MPLLRSRLAVRNAGFHVVLWLYAAAGIALLAFIVAMLIQIFFA